MSREIPLCGGAVAIVDSADFERLGGLKWFLSNNGRPVRSLPGGGRLYLSYAVVGKPPDGLRVNYRNGDKLDNRRANLFFATRRGTKWVKRKSNPSRFIGVRPVKSGWSALYLGGQAERRIGVCRSEEDAARAYDSVARYELGPAAPVNFDDVDPVSFEEMRRRLKRPKKVRLRAAPRPKRVLVRKCPSRYRGVIWVMSKQRWEARVSVCGVCVYIGSFTDEDKAGDACKLAMKEFGVKVKDPSMRGRIAVHKKTKRRRRRLMRDAFLGCPKIRRDFRLWVVSMRTAKEMSCYWCGKNLPKGKRTLDHIIPLSRRGTNRRRNLCCACKGCNSSKRNKLPHEFNKQRLFTFIGDQMPA